jgi:dTMP kinase
MTRGFFVSIEGPEGAGKSTQVRKLVASLRRTERSVVWLREPGSTAAGQRIRGLLLHDRRAALAPMTEALLFFAARAQLMHEQIRPSLARGAVVVCDRFHDSTVAYQGAAGGLGIERMDAMGQAVLDGRLPDLTLLLDVPPQVGLQRLDRSLDRMESRGLAFHRKVRAGFLAIARRAPKRVVVIDATESADVVHDEVMRIVSDRLGRRGAQ